MKIYKIKLFILFIVFCFINVDNICGQNSKTLPSPTIKYGNAVLSGKISLNLLKKNKVHEVELQVYSPISGVKIYKVPIRKDGTFRAKVPMICEGIGFIVVTEICRPIIAFAPNKETVLNISYKNNGQIKVDCDNPLKYSLKDINEAIAYLLDYWHITKKSDYKPNMSLDDYKKIVMEGMKRSLVDIEKSSLSIKGKQQCACELKIDKLKTLFTYNTNLIVAHSNWLSNQNKGVEEIPFVHRKSDISYYSFLKEFDLNNPENLYSTKYYDAMVLMLEDSTLNIPSIGDQPVNLWLANVVNILKDAVGFDKGLFYEMLVANAYGKCLTNRCPFTEIQKKNITDYFANDAYAKFLFNENDALLTTIKKDSAKKIVINNSPLVSKEQILDKIIEKYKGKVVYVDFWATWCGPCIESIREFEPIKENELKDKNVVYVYITSLSSPKNKWQVKIQGIEGEHYYIDNDSWDYILDKLGISGIPTSLIYDKNGVMKHKKTVMEAKEIIEWIGELL